MSDPCTCSWGAPHGDPCRSETRDPVGSYQADLRWDYAVGHMNGAAVAFGLMGMAFAIAYRSRPKCGLCGDVQRPDCCDPFARAGRDRRADSPSK